MYHKGGLGQHNTYIEYTLQTNKHNHRFLAQSFIFQSGVNDLIPARMGGSSTNNLVPKLWSNTKLKIELYMLINIAIIVPIQNANIIKWVGGCGQNRAKQKATKLALW